MLSTVLQKDVLVYLCTSKTFTQTHTYTLCTNTYVHECADCGGVLLRGSSVPLPVLRSSQELSGWNISLS